MHCIAMETSAVAVDVVSVNEEQDVCTVYNILNTWSHDIGMTT